MGSQLPNIPSANPETYYGAAEMLANRVAEQNTAAGMLSKGVSSLASYIDFLYQANRIANSGWPDEAKDAAFFLLLASKLGGDIYGLNYIAQSGLDLVEDAVRVLDHYNLIPELQEEFPGLLYQSDTGDISFPWNPDGVPLPELPPEDIPANPVYPTGEPIPEIKPNTNLPQGTGDDIQKDGKASPLVLDLDGNGIDLASVDGHGAVYWDIDQDSLSEASGWISGNDGLLAIDLNHDGIINDHGELFGNETTDGFSVLAAYDSNQDGVIDLNDTQFNDLIVWVDANSNGISETNELFSLTALGISSINLNANLVDYDIAGNHITHESSFTMNGQTHTIVDAWFSYDNMNTIYTGDYTFDARVLGLPSLRGYGNLPDLFISMSMDETLLNMVSQIGTANTTTLLDPAFDLQGRLEAILFRWAGVENVDPASRGAYIDARQLEFLEAYTGNDFIQSNGSSPDPNAGTAAALIQTYDNLFEYFMGQVLFQTDASIFFGDQASFNYYIGEIENSTIDFLHIMPSQETTVDSTEVNDAYLYLTPQSSDITINELGGTDSLLVSSVLASDIRLEYYRSSYDLKIHIGSQTIVVNDHFRSDYNQNNSYDYRQLENIILDDGTKIDLINNITFTGTSASETIYGTNSGNDTLIGLAGNDTLNGYGGDDTYIFGLNFGSDKINEGVNQGQDTIRFIDGIALEDTRMWVDSTNGGDLHIKLLATGDEVVIDGFTSGGGPTTIPQRIEQIVFEGNTLDPNDDVILDLTQGLYLNDTDDAHTVAGSVLNDTLYGNGGNDYLYGLDGNDILCGGTGNDKLYGSTGDDTYIFAVGFGTDTLDEKVGEGTDTIKFVGGISPDDIRLWVDSTNSGDLHIKLLSTGDQINIDGYTSGGGPTTIPQRIEQIVFEGDAQDPNDDVIWDLTQGLYLNDTDDAHTVAGSVLNDTLYGNGGNDYIYGLDGNDTLFGGSGVDKLYGGTGSDTFSFEASSAFTSVDTVQDFKLSENDKLDISELLSGYDPLTNVITDFVRITDSGTSSILSVDADGGANNFVQIATLLSITGLTDEVALEASGTLITVQV
ncbi:MAG: calcium-binding protein [Alphaproteobacteria bacterium]|nr:calcium-binding protein [Alphaproteobacteria bacterium]